MVCVHYVCCLCFVISELFKCLIHFRKLVFMLVALHIKKDPLLCSIFLFLCFCVSLFLCFCVFVSLCFLCFCVFVFLCFCFKFVLFVQGRRLMGSRRLSIDPKQTRFGLFEFVFFAQSKYIEFFI